MQSYYDPVPRDEATIPSPQHDSTTTAAATAIALPAVSFVSSAPRGGGHEQEPTEESGIYMIGMASTSASGQENDSQAATLLASKTVASVKPTVAPKTTKKLIFQLDDQQRDTFDLDEKVYPVIHLQSSTSSTHPLNISLCTKQQHSRPFQHNQLH